VGIDSIQRTNLCFEPEIIGPVDFTNPEAVARAAKEYCIRCHKKMHKIVADKLAEYYEGVAA
jgi:hypothetical protein